jgi:transketolase
MAAICNGIYAHGGLRPYCATFLNFIGYALGAVRLSALSKFGVIYVMTHDSIGLGEDGPTHQPIEMLEYLRSTPNRLTIRPADGNEVAGAYIVAMERTSTPTVLSLSRQAAPTLENSAADKVQLGAYVVKEIGYLSSMSYPTLTIVATGTEVSLAIETGNEAYSQMTAASAAGAHPVPIWIRVVSMPCCELFDEQPINYQKSVFMEGSPVLSIEAAGVRGWRHYAHACYGMDNCFGASGSGGALLKHFGFTKEHLASKCQEVVSFYTTGKDVYPKAPCLVNYPHLPTLNGKH